ncbi:hypothetical protein BLX88_04660, partial [Bacillus obstructivus]
LLHGPLFGIGAFRGMTLDQVIDHVFAHFRGGLAQIRAVHQFETLFEDHLALIIHHVIVFQEVLADVEVAGFDLLLRLFQGLVDPGMDDGLVFLQAQLLQHAVHALGTENAHEIVLQRQEEL